jgi:Fungal cellulose binding domain
LFADDRERRARRARRPREDRARGPRHLRDESAPFPLSAPAPLEDAMVPLGGYGEDEDGEEERTRHARRPREHRARRPRRGREDRPRRPRRPRGDAALGPPLTGAPLEAEGPMFAASPVEGPGEATMMGGYGDDGDGECARRWEQCAGGLDYIGPICCTGNSECTRKNAWYGQCTPLPVPLGVSAWWAPCGGRGYRGPTACEEGSECMQQDEFYSQCVPVM